MSEEGNETDPVSLLADYLAMLSETMEQTRHRFEETDLTGLSMLVEQCRVVSREQGREDLVDSVRLLLEQARLHRDVEQLRLGFIDLLKAVRGR